VRLTQGWPRLPHSYGIICHLAPRRPPLELPLAAVLPEPHHHIVNVTVSGSWWQGAPDERGIPHTLMADGAPNGYSIIRFDGHRYRLDFKAAGRPDDYQMQIYAPEEVAAAEARKTQVYVNVFNGSARSKVELRVGRSDWRPMQQVAEQDPGYRRVYELEKSLKDKPWRELSEPKASTHLWKAPLPKDLEPGTHLLEVRTTDMHGRTHESHRVIRIRSAQTAASGASK